MPLFEGIFPALITPFTTTGQLDEAAARRVIQYNMDKGVDGFYVCGSTGESLLMNMQQRKRILEVVVDEVQGHAKVLAHIGCFHTGDSIALAEHAASVGADAVSSLPPFYYKFTLQELTRYYLDIAEAVGVPMIVYNAPALTGVSFDQSNLGGIFANENVVGVKFTAYDLFQMQRLIAAYPDKLIINGHDELYLPSLSIGSRCAIGSTFNFMAEVFIQIRKLYLEKRLDEAAEMQNKANAVIAVLIEVGVFRAVKGMLNLLGLEVGECRKPFLPLTKQEYAQLEAALKTLHE